MDQATIGKGGFPEPLKYRQTEDSRWVLTDEWKEWRERRRTLETKPKEKKRKRVVTAENHVPVWREVAYHTESGKKVFFCTCMSNHGDPFKGCGAAGVQYSRTGIIHEVIGSRFE